MYKYITTYYTDPKKPENIDFDSWFFKSIGIKTKEEFLLDYYYKKCRIEKTIFLQKVGASHKHQTDKYAEFWEYNGFMFRTFWGGGSSILRSRIDIFYNESADGIFIIPTYQNIDGSLCFTKFKFENISKRKLNSIQKLLTEANKAISLTRLNINAFDFETFKKDITKLTNGLQYKTI